MGKRKRTVLPKSPFRTWFEAQYGPSPGDYSKALGAVAKAELDAGLARTHFAKVQRWERAKDAALKGWCAREKRDG